MLGRVGSTRGGRWGPGRACGVIPDGWYSPFVRSHVLLLFAVGACGGSEATPGVDASVADVGVDVASEACVAPTSPQLSVVDTSTASEVIVQGEDAALGIFDPSVVDGAQFPVLSYSRVPAQDSISTQTAWTGDPQGGSWNRDINPVNASQGVGCGDAGSCTTTLVYEVSTLVATSSDWEVLAHAYVFDHSLTPPTRYERGFIGLWSIQNFPDKWTPAYAMRWNTDAVAAAAPEDLSQVAELSDCVAFTEPGAVWRGTLDVALGCVSTKGIRIVLLRRSAGPKLDYVGTLLSESDAIALGSDGPQINAADLFRYQGDEYLIVSPRGPVKNLPAGGYDGCVTVKMQDADHVARDCTGNPVVVRRITEKDGRFIGACTFSSFTGYYAGVGFIGESTRPFRIYRTGIMTP